MKIQFKDTFIKSLERMVWHQHWIYKTYATFRYDIPLFFKNIWRFRKELYNHQWWDYRFTLEMLYRSLSIMVVKLEIDGIEIDSSRMKKVNAIKRTLKLIKHKLDDDYIERAELELGKIHNRPIIWEKIENEDLYRLVDDDTPEEKKHVNKVYKRARAIEEKEWKELWDIFKGRKFTTWDKYDGSDLRGWWD